MALSPFGTGAGPFSICPPVENNHEGSMMKKKSDKKELRPRQHQNRQPGLETKMRPQPQSEKDTYRGSGKLQDKVVIITGGDSGIGRAAAIAFAKEGADLVIIYLNEHGDARETKRQVEAENRRCLTLA